MKQAQVSHSTLLKQHFIDFYTKPEPEVELPEDLINILKQPNYEESITIETLVDNGSDKLVMTLSSPHFTSQPQTYTVAGVSKDPDIYQQDVFDRTYESLEDAPTDLPDCVVRLTNPENGEVEFVILVDPETLEDDEYAKLSLLNIFLNDTLINFFAEDSTNIAGQTFDFMEDCVYNKARQELEIVSPTVKGTIRIVTDTRLPVVEENDLGKLVPRRM